MILLNNTPTNLPGFSENIFETGLSIYEVIRIFKGHPIFLQDNLLRLANSIKKSDIRLDVQSLKIRDKLDKLIALEHIEEGNIRYVLHLNNGQTDEYIYQIPHSYPTTSDYQEGVDTISYHVVRQNPEVKYHNAELRTLANRLMHEHWVYEILLVDDDQCITEGSRSNVFFIKGDVIYTAPTNYVLPGTSRKRILEICKHQNTKIMEERVECNTISDFDAIFLTGTSPLILPVRKIDGIAFDVNNRLLRTLMKHYFTLIENIF